MSALFSLTDVFFLGAVFCSFLAANLLWKNAYYTYTLANRTLALFFFVTGYCIFGYIIISTHIIQEEYLMNNQMNTIQIIISILAGMITLLTEPMKTMVKYRIIIIIIE